MIDCNPFIKLPKSQEFVTLLNELQNKVKKTRFDAETEFDLAVPTGAGTQGTLGGFTTKVKGKINCFANRWRCAWEARGKMSFVDTYNFDPKGFFNKDSFRSSFGELQTQYAHYLLPGKPFKLTSVTTDFSQSNDDKLVRWAGGKPQIVHNRISKTELEKD